MSRWDGGWATLVNRLKAVLPHFVGHVKAPAPKIIMRRSATSERTVTPAPGIIIEGANEIGVRLRCVSFRPSQFDFARNADFLEEIGNDDQN
jgi:hypothetical protein